MKKRITILVVSLLFVFSTAFAAEVTIQNDSVEDFGLAMVVGDFVAGEHGGVRLTAPSDGDIVAVQVLWLEGTPGHGQSIEQAIHIYDGSSFPSPGTELETIVAPVMTPGAMNEFRYLDENQMFPLNVPVTAGQQFYVTLEFANPTDVGSGGPSVVRDTDGCQAGSNVLYAIPGGWLNFCLIISGDIAIRAVLDTEGPANEPPVISNIVRNPEFPGQGVQCEISATITDLALTSSVTSAHLHYDVGTGYVSASMSNTADSFYATIPGQFQGTNVYYYITALDNEGDSTVSDTSSFTVGGSSDCLNCVATCYTPVVPNDGGFIIWDIEVTNCGGTSVPVWVERRPVLGDCASGTPYSPYFSQYQVASNLAPSQTYTGYYHFQVADVSGLTDASVDLGVGPSNGDWIGSCCFEFVFSYPGMSIGNLNAGEWGEVFERSPGTTLPSMTALNSNYPNPFNATTTISFDIAHDGNVDLSVYNLAGQHIETLINGNFNAGHHTVTWNASTYSSGIYFSKLTTDNNTQTKRMTLLK
ncbi:MAG: T9SS type A sorting domain-containing protein [candidate division Zixibacteria bacterium]|nr:T9SS type A sorting domain-containing protein [candidate division Zixibacteria bacterium]